MGFFKDLNEMKKTGKEMQKEKFGTSNPFKIMKQGVAQGAEMLHGVQAEQEKAQRLMADSLHGEAIIKAMRDTGVQINMMPQMEFDLEVHLDGRDPYTVTHRQVVPFAMIGQLQPGATVPVRVDMNDPNSLIIAS